MNPDTAFDVGLPDYSVHFLHSEDSAAIQELWEICADYMLLLNGCPNDPQLGEGAFTDVPPGRSAEDLAIFGIIDRQGGLVGILHTLPGYPDENTWWIGVYVLIPELRSQGIGEQVVKGFEEYVRLRGYSSIMLGVVKKNKRASKFLKRIGFTVVRQTRPHQFGYSIHRVIVMRKSTSSV